jgi:transcription regulator MmyB-like protein
MFDSDGPVNSALIALVGQLSTRSQAFRVRWAAHDVKAHRAGAKMFRHPLLGELTLPFENLTVDAAGDQVLTVFTPQPGSPEHDAIRMLAGRNVSIPEDAESSSDT